MPTTTLARPGLGAVLLALALAAPAAAGEFTVAFPTNVPPAAQRTQWRVVWGVEHHAGGSEVLYIKEAFYKRTLAGPEVKVLGDTRLAEIFVAYNSPTRYYDISNFSFPLVNLDKSMLGPPCLLPGTIYNREGGADSTGPVAVEAHDGQLRWMNGSNKVYRGQGVSMWAVLSAANYRYVMLYDFRDDGYVSLRAGATAHNLNAADNDATTHLHTAFWRVNMDLGAPAALKVSKVEQAAGTLATTATALDKEARFVWNPQAYTRVRIENPRATNGHAPTDKPIGYELMPVRTGIARLLGGGSEDMTLNDFWVTRQKAGEFKPVDLPGYENGESLGDGPATLWHSASVLHVARDEDFGPVGTNNYAGVAITAWCGFDLKPRNFFPSTPLYP